MADRLQAYEVFAELMERRNFTETSKALGVPQPTISKHIVSLENALGVQLFMRSTRRTVPTIEAFELLPMVRQLLEANDQITRKARGVLPEVSGTLRIAAPPTYARHVLLHQLIAFRKLHPLIEFEITTTDRPTDLAANQIDLALTESDKLEGPYIQRLIARPVLQVAGPRDHLDREGRPLFPVDLEKRMVVIAESSLEKLEFDSEHGHESVRVAAPIRCDDLHLALETALEIGALTVGPSWIFAVPAYRERFEVVLTDYVMKPMPIRLFYPVTQFLPARTRTLIDFLAPGPSEQKSQSSPLISQPSR